MQKLGWWSWGVLGVLGVLGVVACAEPGGGSSVGGETIADTGAGETIADAADSGAGDTGGGPSTDSGAATDTNVAPDVAPDTVVSDALQPGTGPDDPTVGCLSDRDCSDGKLCCTLALSYLSDCVAPADCHEGLHDACLVDEQCAAREPGQWTACCHDLGNRNYCAPVAQTCQPLVACDTIVDCEGNGNDVCCSEHPYYGRAYCTNTFFAKNVEADCP